MNTGDATSGSTHAVPMMICPVCGRRVPAGTVCSHGASAQPMPPPMPPPLPPLAAERPAHPPPPLQPRRSIMEILLDPRSIQWMLASGGVLLVVGMVVWLASLRVFENPVILAATMSIGTLVLLAAGWWVIRSTQFQLAGQAVTLLACLVMPLNLWFFHAQNLMTLDGHLWVAAVVCCALYAASAFVLKDPLFVYVLVAGVAGTGLLILGDLGKFAQITAPSIMLIVMGLMAIHSERAFPVNDGPFARKRFGLAFFFSGHALLAAGLLLLLGAQFTSWVLRPLFWGWNITPPEITVIPALKIVALVLVLAGTYAYVYSDLVVRRVGAYIYPAAFTLLWAELLGLQMLNVSNRAEIILGIVAITALLLNIAHSMLKGTPIARGILPLALLLSLVPVAYGVLLHFRATHAAFHTAWPYTTGWGYVGAMLIAALACRIGAHLHRETNGTLSSTYFFLTAAASLVGAAGLLAVGGLRTWSTQAPILMLIPIGYLIASQLYRDPIEKKSLLGVAQISTIVMIISVLLSATNLAPRVFEPVQGAMQNLTLAIFFAEAAIFYAFIAGIRQQGFHVFLATAMAGCAMWQLLNYFDTPAEAYMVNFAVLGLLLLILSRFAPGAPGRSATAAGNSLMTLAFLSSVLKVTAKLLVNSPRPGHAWLLGLIMIMTLAAAVVVGAQSGWRRAYIVMAIITGMLGFVLLGTLAHLSGWQKAEVFAVGAGLVLLICGHIGWFREQGTPSDTVSFSLLWGALLAGVPLLIAAVVNRFGAEISLVDEIMLITISALMLLSGAMLQLRATTIVGGALLAIYFPILLVFFGWKSQMAVGAYLAIGGALLFLIGLGLAIYRERLMELPEKVLRREGVFRILAWR